MKREEALFTVAYWLSYAIACVLYLHLDFHLARTHIHAESTKDLWNLGKFYLAFYFPSLGFFGWFNSRIGFIKRALLSNGLALFPVIHSFAGLFTDIKQFQFPRLISEYFQMFGLLLLLALYFFTVPLFLSLVVVGLLAKKQVQAGKQAAVKGLRFFEFARQMVVGQDLALETIQRVIVANSRLANSGDPKRNKILAAFLFVGPTGVGKTETAKVLADWLKKEGYDFLRIDANQFADRESLWTLLGAAKGYMGSEEPGLLPSAISRNPRRVILIDEIEKADQGFYQPLLQLLDEGYVIERSTGQMYHVERAIVIITSNLENRKIAEIVETLDDPIKIDIEVRKTLERAVIDFAPSRSFRITPEFLGRIDQVVPFRSLDFEDLVLIAYNELRRLKVDISLEETRSLTQRYYPLAKEYGVRYFLKKIREDVLTQ
jgi:hypothetical protein